MTTKLFDLKGKVAVITGAGRGIGRSIALGMARCGADIVLWSRTQDELDNVSNEIRRIGPTALPMVVDITQIARFDGLLQEVKRSLGHIDILVNNAGIAIVSPAVDVDEKSWDAVMDTNVKSAFFLAQKLGRLMIQQGQSGSIINITSEVAERIEPNLGAYCPSKAALNNITKMLAREWGKHSIRVNSLAPCFVKTSINEALFADKEFYERRIKGVPLGRNSVPDDLVGAAIFLASDAAKYVTGISILVDGGYTA